MLFAFVEVVLSRLLMPVGVYLLWELIKKWLNTDTHRDFIMTMGPMHSGKSELQDAYQGKPYKPDRMENVGWKEPVKVGEKGSKLCIAIPDFGGAINEAKEYCKKIIEEIEQRKPDYILTQLVFDASKLPSSQGGILDVAVGLQFYLNMLNKRIDANPKCHAAQACKDGHWRYEIVGTHRDVRTAPGPEMLQQMEEVISNHSKSLNCGKDVCSLRPVCRKITLLDLRSDEGRKQAVQHLIDTLKTIHEE